MIQHTNIQKTNKEITKKLTTIENSLKRKLQSFYNSKVKGSLSPIEVLRGQYETQVRNMIRSTVQDAYFTGTKIVTDQITKINDNFEVFISTTDIANISNLSSKLSDQFWKTAGRLHQRETAYVQPLAGQQLELKPEFDTTAAMIGMGAYAAYLAFNNAVVSKMQILNNPIELQSGLLLETGFEIPLEGKIMFLTQEDAAVDTEICEPLNRTVYDVNDFDIPEPPLHNHCRCRLVPIVDETEALF